MTHSENPRLLRDGARNNLFTAGFITFPMAFLGKSSSIPTTAHS